MTTSYLPQREQELDTWIASFKTKIAASPTTYGLVALDATAITKRVHRLARGLSAGGRSRHGTKKAIVAKNTQKAIIVPLIRGYARTIGRERAVSDALKPIWACTSAIPPLRPCPLLPPSPCSRWSRWIRASWTFPRRMRAARARAPGRRFGRHAALPHCRGGCGERSRRRRSKPSSAAPSSPPPSPPPIAARPSPTSPAGPTLAARSARGSGGEHGDRGVRTNRSSPLRAPRTLEEGIGRGMQRRHSNASFIASLPVPSCLPQCPQCAQW